MLTIFILFVLYGISLWAIWHNSSDKLTLRIYLLSNAFYFALVPLEWYINALCNNGKSSDFDIDTYGISALVTMAILSLWGMFLPLHFLKFTEPDYTILFDLAKKKILKNALPISIFLILILFATNYRTLFSLTNYGEGLKLLFENPILSVALSSILILFFVASLGFIAIEKKSINLVLVVLPFGIVGLLLKSKDELVWGLFIFWILVQHTTAYGKVLFRCIVVALLCSPILNWLFIGWRLEGMANVLNIISNLEAHNFYYKSDAGGILYSFTETYKSKENLDYSYGLGYVQELVQLIPKFIYPNRPEDISILFSKTRIENWTPGFGLGYSPLAEAYRNFGILGGFIHFFILGTFWVCFWKIINFLTSFLENKTFLIAMYLSIAGLWWFSLPRMPMVAIYKNTLIYSIPFVFLYFFTVVRLPRLS